jgi:uncharacterized protein (DUF927 family)
MNDDEIINNTDEMSFSSDGYGTCSKSAVIRAMQEARADERKKIKKIMKYLSEVYLGTQEERATGKLVLETLLYLIDNEGKVD